MGTAALADRCEGKRFFSAQPKPTSLSSACYRTRCREGHCVPTGSVDSSTLVALNGLRARIMSLDAAGTVVWVNVAMTRLRQSQQDDTIAATGIGSSYIEVCRRARNLSGPLIVEGLRAVLGGATTYVELDADLGLGTDHRTQLTVTPAPTSFGGALVMQIEVRATFRRSSEVVPARIAPVTMEMLTARERVVLSLMARGLDNRSIADHLGVGYATVRSHVRSIMAKLGARSRLEAVVRAAELDLVQLPQTGTAGSADGAAPR